MKKYIFLLVIFSLTVLGNQKWIWKNPQPQGNTLYAVQLYHSLYGFAVGESGTILATVNGGATWELQYEAITDHLRDVCVLDSATAWIAGDNGTILKTTNGGEQWLEQMSGTTEGLNGIYFVDKNFGCAVGDTKTILVTTNGGAVWSKKTVSGVSNSSSLISVFFVSTSEGWIAGSGGIILHTTNGGGTWSLQYSTSTTAMKIRFVNQTTGFVVGDKGTIYRTTNSGTNWSKITSPTTSGLNDIEKFSANEMWICGDDGVLLYSTDAGATWKTENLKTYASVYGLASTNSEIFAVGEFGLLANKKENTTWVLINSGEHNNINWMGMNSAGIGIAVGDYGYMARSADWGKTWSGFYNGITLDSFYGLQITESGKIWTVGDLGVILYSSNSGVTWKQQTTYITNTLFSINFVNENIGWAVGNAGEIIHTTNGGETWTKLQSTTTKALYSVNFISESEGWCCGENGILLHSTNSGVTWSVVTTGITEALYSLFFENSQKGFCVGNHGTILRTDDGGKNWITVQSGSTKSLFSIAGKKTQYYVVGDSGFVLTSTDAGSSWNTEFASTEYPLLDVIIPSDTISFLCGANGTILQKSLDNVVNVNSSHFQLANNCELYQNYPNPFNPTTTINYQLLIAGNVTLKIYDALGREVSTLVNEEKEPGSYTVQWNAEKLSSGIYFAKLQSGKNIQVKKMLLQK